ncbi:hypothetical protein [Nonomuraea pusilla]|uniref:Uncharacterized protein n=1 Tax=Nonomuraea pusilla TaxID=46177 RepID=A0A1H8E2W4_9ACTN|nr:hypothetical protein [Nonomuraea pusilla]SEN13108.1 hypothetical protein SAMN05660976_06874 [Nonomuraea pusilla]
MRGIISFLGRGRLSVAPVTVFWCGHEVEMVPDWLLSFRQVQVVRARRGAEAAGIICVYWATCGSPSGAAR